MTVSSVGGSSGGVFSWSASYNDQGPGTATVQADGQGRDTVVVQQEDGQQAAIQFVQPGQEANPVPIPPGVTVVSTVQVVIGSGPFTIRPIRLDPFPPSKPGGVPGFRVTNEEWHAT